MLFHSLTGFVNFQLSNARAHDYAQSALLQIFLHHKKYLQASVCASVTSRSLIVRDQSSSLIVARRQHSMRLSEDLAGFCRSETSFDCPSMMGRHEPDFILSTDPLLMLYEVLFLLLSCYATLCVMLVCVVPYCPVASMYTDEKSGHVFLCCVLLWCRCLHVDRSTSSRLYNSSAQSERA